MQHNEYKYRYVAQILIEATTPLRTASGKSDIFIDSPILKDWNGLPMILGSSIAGVLRHSFDDDNIVKEIFGYEEENKDDGEGSRIIVSHAHLCDNEGKVYQELGLPKNEFLERYANLPVREHTAINHKGSAKDKSKFDEEVVFAGSRFRFELEFISKKQTSDTDWQKILDTLSNPLLRFGAGGTKGFGQFKIIECYESCYEMGKNYDQKPSDLNKIVGTQISITPKAKQHGYVINLQPENFFIFGAGFGDDEVDDIAVTEDIVTWCNDSAKFSSCQILFPASSLKGALSHRVAFHYNRLNGKYADEVDSIDNYVGTNNHAVATIFGAPKGHANEGKGKALFSDMYKPYNQAYTKIFDHVKIDRFTGGAVDGALFNEKTIANNDTWQVEILLSPNIDVVVKEAFEATLDDLAKGWLPLGGKVNRGHGVFISPDYEEGNSSKRGWQPIGGEDV